MISCRSFDVGESGFVFGDLRLARTPSCPKSGFRRAVLDSIRRLDPGRIALGIAENPTLRQYSVTSALFHSIRPGAAVLDSIRTRWQISFWAPGDASRIFSGLGSVESPIRGYLGQQWLVQEMGSVLNRCIISAGGTAGRKAANCRGCDPLPRCSRSSNCNTLS